MDFQHLHCHSHFSLLDGLTKLKPLIKAFKERGFQAATLTDYGSLYGAIKFIQTCQAEDIKPIIGFEAYIAPRKMSDQDPQYDKQVYHLILLAENYEGYKNLMKLSSLGHLDGFFNGKPRLDKEILKQYSKNIIALSGCIRGEVPQLLKQGKIEEAKKSALEYNEIFGANNFYLELQDHPAIEGQIDVNTKLIELSKDTGIPMVVSRDVHYLDYGDAEAQDILTCIREGWKVGQTDREDYRHVDRSLNTASDIISRFRHVPEALENTIKIRDRINFEIELDSWHFAPVDVPKGKNVDEYLHDLVYEKVLNFYPALTDEIKERIEYEFGIISGKGYSPYFICVADYVKYAKDNGIVETTRGSGAGSLISYVMGITTVDPLRFKLPFERFLNPFRPSPPDIDTDFADDRRDDMIKYVTEKYGVDKVAQIITFGTMAARGSVRDVGRALGLSYSFCDQVSKLIPMGSQGFAMTIKRAIDEEPDLKKLYTTNEDVKRLLELAQKVEGCARHTSIHAAGVVISPTPLTDFSPVQHESAGGRLVTQYEMKSVESAGVLKYDFLGIRNLSILGRSVEIVKATTGDEIDIYSLPLDDTTTFEMLARGETMGVFQLGGSGMTKWLKELKPNRIEDIMAMVALYRPGPMESIPEYIKRKYNPEFVRYLDPKLEKILDASYGLLVYQDDVMLTAIELAGYDWMEADKFRKAMGKKIPLEMARQKIKFYDGCKNHGKVAKNVVDELWHAIEPFAAYGFNKCLVGETEILNPVTGQLKIIQELFDDDKKFSVLSLNSTSKLKRESVEKVYNNGKKKVWEIKTKSGRKITATTNHPFLKFAGWANLGQLKLGDQIAVPRQINYTSSQRIHKDKLKTLGYLLAEGNLCHPHGVYFYSSVEIEVKDFIGSLQVFENIKYTIDSKKKTMAVYVGQKDTKKGNSLYKWLSDLGLIGKKATEKVIPDFVFGLPKDQLACLLGAMWQGDGCVKDDKYGQIYYATSSEKMVKQMQHLLLRLEIISTIHTKKFKYRNGFKIGYTLQVSRYNNIEKFANSIGRYLLPNKQKILYSLVTKNKVLNKTIQKNAARGTKDIIPADILNLIRKEMLEKNVSIKNISKKLGIAERLFYHDKNKKGYLRETILKIGKYLQSNKLLQHANSDIYWDEVVSIEYKGIKTTYDLTVPVGHNFVANDFIVHNSHAASYGIVAYQTAYMKAHYPVQYMTAVLQAEFGDSDKVAEIFHECSKMNIKILPPDINESFRNFAMVSKPGEPGVIRFGLNAIKNVGKNICDVIYTERKKGGSYKSLEDLLERAQDKDLNKRSLDSLIKSGAMDCFEIDRGLLLSNIENILFFSRQLKEKNLTNQDSLFAGTGIDLDSKVTLKDADEATMDDKLLWEKELLGVYVSSHPFKYYSNKFSNIFVPLGTLEETGRDKWVVVGGVIDKTQKKITKKGQVMMFVSIQDMTGKMELLVFPKTYETTKDIWQEGEVICVVGKTPKEDGDDKIFVEKAFTLTKENAEQICGQFSHGKTAVEDTTQTKEKSIFINLTKKELQEKTEDLKKIFNKYEGDYQVFIRIEGKTIKTQAMIDWNSVILDEVESLVGEGKMEVFE